MKRFMAVLLVILMVTMSFTYALAERPLLFEMTEANEAQSEQKEVKDQVRLTDFLARYAWLCQKFDIEYRISPPGLAGLFLVEDGTYSYLATDISISKIDPETFDIGNVRYNPLQYHPEDAKHSMAVVYSMVNAFWWEEKSGKNAMEGWFTEHYLEDYENLKEASKNGGADLGNGYSAIYRDRVVGIAANKLLEQ